MAISRFHHYHRGENGSPVSGAWTLYIGQRSAFKGWYSVLPGKRDRGSYAEVEVALGGEDNMLQFGVRLPLLGCCYVGVRVPRWATRGWVYQRREWAIKVGYIGDWAWLLFAHDDAMADMADYYRRQREQPNCERCKHYASFHDDPVRIPPARVTNPARKCVTHSQILHGSAPCECPGYKPEKLRYNRAHLWPGLVVKVRPRLKDRLLGREVCTTTEGEMVPVLVPMPEGNYPGTVKREERVWKRKRWPWSERRRVDFWVDMQIGVPTPGKGENSWDCDDDGVYGTGGSSVPEAVANVVRAALRNRERYGSGASWVPSRGWPEGIDRRVA